MTLPVCLSPTPLSLTCVSVYLCLTCLSRRVDDLACLSVPHPSLTHLYIRLPVCLTCLSRRVDDLACLSVPHPSLTHLYIRLPVCLTCLSRRVDDLVYRLSLSRSSLPRPFCPSPTPLSVSPVCHLYIRLPVCLTCLSRRADDRACLSVPHPSFTHLYIRLPVCLTCLSRRVDDLICLDHEVAREGVHGNLRHLDNGAVLGTQLKGSLVIL